MRASVFQNGPCQRRLEPAALALSLMLLTLLFPSEATAYTWMVRHEYTACRPCHLDVSGGGILTPYGRALGTNVLDTQYVDELDEESTVGQPLFGLVKLPEPLMLGGDLRALYYSSKLEGAAADDEFMLMQADLLAAVKFGGFMASGSIGYAETGAFAAAITRAPEKNLVSRHYWAGYEFDEETSLAVRAGRMNLPFGIRTVEHTLWVRSLTRTSINADQQFGVAASFAPGAFRTELMAILGNFQIHPDDYRERGYSAYLEWFPLHGLAVGASSLLTHREVDPEYLKETWRHAHGLFARWATPWQPLVLLAEADYTLRSPKDDFRREGIVGYLQADLEPFQGLHLLLTGEANDVGLDGTPFSWGVWFSQQWFFAPHFDVRFDSVFQSLGDEFGRTDALTFLAQGHFYL